MSGFTRKSLADHLDSYDDEITEIQNGKRDTLNDYRAQLAERGLSKQAVKAEVEALKIAMRRRRAIAKKGEDEIDQADALADEIFVAIMPSAPRATRAREMIEEFDAKTGEITEQNSRETASGRLSVATSSEPHGMEDAGGDSVERHATNSQSPSHAAVVTDDHLREPMAAASGQIVREDGDAPQEASDGGNLSDTELQMDRADDGSFETGIEAAGNRLEANPAGPVTGEVSHVGAGESPATIPEPFEPPAFLIKEREPVNERCQQPQTCLFGHHPQKITCSTCSTAWAISQRKSRAA